MRPVHAAVAAIMVAPLIALAPGTTASAHRNHAPVAADPSVISEWNRIAMATIAADATATPPKVGTEVYIYTAFVHVAVYNAVVGITGGYEPYRFGGRPAHGASPQAAAVAAAHRVLVSYSPAQAASLDAAYAASLAAIPDGRAERRGVAYGERAAADLIRDRADDGRNAPVTFDMPVAPGVWTPTPPANLPFQNPWIAFMDPLMTKNGSQFDPGPPPRLTSARYAAHFNEVKAYGSATSTVRTPAQHETAMFFAGNPAVQFTTALQHQAVLHDMDIAESARMFAAVHASLADATVAIWWTKHHYGLWRPITAIRQADTDGNPATAPDATWNSVIPSPPYPEYVSGYNGVMGAFAEALRRVLDTNDLDLTLISTTFPEGDPRRTRHYTTVGQVCAELVDARVWLGIHFRFADTAAAELGQDIADYGLDRNFRPVDGDDGDNEDDDNNDD